jgi:hypothetical protein
MKKPSFLILITTALQVSGHFGFYLECVNCHHITFVMLRLAKDGIELSGSDSNCFPPSWSHSKPFLEVTENGNLLISCGACRSDDSQVTVSKVPVGTLCSPENSEERRAGERRKIKPILNSDYGNSPMRFGINRSSQDRRRHPRFDGEEQARLLRKRLEFFR